jgi:type II secretory pathway component PulJ
MRISFDEHGFTLVEMLVSTLVTLVVFGAVVTLLQVFLSDNQTNIARNAEQDSARTAIDRMSRQLRNVAAPASGAVGALEVAGPYEMIFQTVSSSPPPNGSLNALNQMRVRYCLNTGTPSNEQLYVQTQTWTTASTPAIPTTSTCPNTAWATQTLLLSNITNEIDNQDRPLFTYAPLTETSTQQINGVQVDLYVDPNPGREPQESNITSSIFLRNSLTPPVASFTYSQPGGYIELDASSAYDPNGQALSYQWYLNGTCPNPTGSPVGTTQQYNAGNSFTARQNYTFSLVVTDTAGLTTCTSQTVTAVA